MSSESPSASASSVSAADDQALAAVHRIQQRLTELQNAQQAQRRWTRGVTVLLVAQALLFTWALYSSIRTNFFDRQRVLAAVTPRVEALYPLVRDEGMNVVRQVAPVYQELALARFQASAPKLVDGFESEIRQLAVDLNHDARQSLEVSLNRVAKRLEPDVQASFPALADPAAQERITQAFEQRVQAEFVVLNDKLQGMYQKESHKVWDAVMALNAQPQPQVEPAEMERLLLHHLITLADYEVLHAGEKDSATEVLLDMFSPGDAAPQAPAAPASN